MSAKIPINNAGFEVDLSGVTVEFENSSRSIQELRLQQCRLNEEKALAENELRMATLSAEWDSAESRIVELQGRLDLARKKEQVEEASAKRKVSRKLRRLSPGSGQLRLSWSRSRLALRRKLRRLSPGSGQLRLTWSRSR